MKRLVLAGGGHAHLAVLRALAGRRPSGVKIVLVTPTTWQIYSGMLPGWIAGHYRLEDIRIDLRPLAKAAGILLIEDRVESIDADRQCVGLSDGAQLEYDVLSLDTGSETDLSWLGMAGNRLIPVKPLDGILEAWPRILAAATAQDDYRLAVVGGGPAAVELAMAARHAFRENGSQAGVVLVCSEDGLMKDHAPAVRQRIHGAVAEAGIRLLPFRAAGAEQGLLLANGELLPADRIIAATGPRPPYWLPHSGLRLDGDGYVAVDDCHRNLSHRNVFAAGDVCARREGSVTRSGVHAVHAGPVLAHNLMVSLSRGVLMPYRPRAHSLYLVSCGSRSAVASWGRWGLEGQWVWRWKDWIDRRFIRRFSR